MAEPAIFGVTPRMPLGRRVVLVGLPRERWVVLALLESSATRAAVLAELKASTKAISKSTADGCRSLGAALKAAASARRPA